MAKKSAPSASEPTPDQLEAAMRGADGGDDTPPPKKSRAPKAVAGAAKGKAKAAVEEDDEPKTAKPHRAAKLRSSDELEADVKSRLLGPKPAAKAAAKAKAEDPEDDLDDEQEEEREVERTPRRRPAASRRDEDFDDEEDDRREAISEDTLILAEESGLTHAELLEEIDALGSERAVVSMLTRARRQARRMSHGDDEDDRPQRREPAARQSDEERPAVIPTKSNEDDIDFEKEFALEGELAEDENVKSLVGQLTKHVSPRIRALAKRTEAALKRIEAHEQRVAHREAVDQQRQLDKLYAEADPHFVELFGKAATRKLPANSTYAANREDHQNEMIDIQNSRRRRGLPFLEFEEVWQAAAERLFPQTVERRIQEKQVSAQRSIRGTGQLRAGGRRSPLPQGRDKAIETLSRKREEYGHD